MRRASRAYRIPLRYREIVREIENYVAKPRRPLDSYEYDKYVHLIDIPLRDTIVGCVNGERNLLVFNFWAVMFGLLMNTDVSNVINWTGGVYTIRTSGIVNAEPAHFRYGSGTIPETFTQYNIISAVGSATPSISFGQLADRNRITLSAVIPSDSQEIGIFQTLYDTSGNTRLVMFARKQMFIPANKTVNWYIDFLKPWTRNWALLMYGILGKLNAPGAVDVDNNTYILRTYVDVNAGPARIRVSKSPYSWSPDLCVISYDLEMTTYYWLSNLVSVVYLFLVGIATPSSDLTVNTIALIQSLYDSTGASHDTYVLILPLSNPITLYAGRTNMIFLRFVAM